MLAMLGLCQTLQIHELAGASWKYVMERTLLIILQGMICTV
jgi:hypothetical protein